MFCPACRVEYRPGFTHCNDCDVDLVEALPPLGAMAGQATEDEIAESQALEMFWSGADGGLFARITGALAQAEIPFNDEEMDPRLLLSSSGRPLEIWIRTADHEKANQALQSVLEERSEMRSRAAEPTSDAPGYFEGMEDVVEPPSDLLEEFDPEVATAQVWSGEDRGTAQFLSDCLRGNGIGSAVGQGDDGKLLLLVEPRCEARASKIVREVIEGIPPE